MNVRRNIKNVLFNYSEAACRVREATSNDPAPPSVEMMQEIADMTYDVIVFADIMPIIWKRLRDTGKNWRHVHKSLSLRDFRYSEGEIDYGAQVREKARHLVALLKDEERLKNERAKAEAIRQRLMLSGRLFDKRGKKGSHDMYARTGFYSTSFPAYDGVTYPSERELNPQVARTFAAPTNLEEEATQLQIALSMSRDQAKEDGSCPAYQMIDSSGTQEHKMTSSELGKNASESNLFDYFEHAQNSQLHCPPFDTRHRCSSAQPWINQPSTQTEATDGNAEAGKPGAPWDTLSPSTITEPDNQLEQSFNLLNFSECDVTLVAQDGSAWATGSCCPSHILDDSLGTTSANVKGASCMKQRTDACVLGPIGSAADMAGSSRPGDPQSALREPSVGQVGNKRIDIDVNPDVSLLSLRVESEEVMATLQPPIIPMNKDSAAHPKTGTTDPNVIGQIDFLGEHSQLVDLENLLTNPNLLPNNPFALSSMVTPNPTNPFLQKASKPPPLNELMNAAKSRQTD